MEVLVPVLLEQLASITTKLTEQKLSLVFGVAAEVRRLGGYVRLIRKVLEDAENKRVTDDAVEVWLKEVRDVSYEMENVLDEWNTALIKTKIEKEENVLVVETKVRYFIRFPLCCFHPFQKIGLRCYIARKIKELNGKLDDIVRKRVGYGLDDIVKKRVGYGFDVTSGTVLDEERTTTSFADVSVIHGRDKEKVDLLNYLLSVGEENPRVISLVGMGGIGKTALAQHVYNDPDVQARFDIRKWVHVSYPFDQTRVAKAIIESIEGPSANIGQLQTLMERIECLILGRKFFFVLDDVWIDRSDTWAPFQIALRSGKQGSRILVTTRNDNVANFVGSESSGHIINLAELTDEHTWLIVKTMAFVKDENQFQPSEDLRGKLTEKCRGLPLAAKTLGSLMSGQRSIQRWKDILESNLWSLENFGQGLLGTLLLSYYDLPLAIKRCFLYCSFFPINYRFSRDELVYMWMAHGYINPVEGMEFTAERYFENLAKRSLFQDFEKDKNDGTIKSCKMHEIVRGFAQSMTSSECFAFDVDKESGINFEMARHVSLTLTENRSFPESVYTAKDLRTFWLNLNGYSHDKLLLKLFRRLICLRALIMKNIPVERLPKEVENLIHLRLLDLSDNECLRELPESLSNLCNLQTLDVSRCVNLEKFPQRMGKLINLRHLILDNIDLKKPIPKDIGRLSSLRTLTQFMVGCMDDHEGCTLEELKDLDHLQGALTIKGLGNAIDVSKAEKAQLKKKVGLCHLSLSFIRIVEENRGVNDKLVLKDLEPHPDLETLEIISYEGTMYPDWIMLLARLKRLQLRSCDKLECLPPLGELPSLKSLEIAFANGLEKVGVEFLGNLGIQSNERKNDLFPKLESLTFTDLSSWEEWDGIGGRGEGGDVSVMPHLQHLDISNCQNLKALPDFLERTPLQELNIGCFQISNWMILVTAKSLRKLNLNIHNDIEHLPPLGELPFLEELEIQFADNVKKVGAEFLGIESNNEGSTSSSPILFPKLIRLVFRGLLKWAEWDGIGGMREEGGVTIMPRLHFLKIENCPMLNSLPDFIRAKTLNERMITECPNLQQC